jgi:hypothetical protein
MARWSMKVENMCCAGESGKLATALAPNDATPSQRISTKLRTGNFLFFG